MVTISDTISKMAETYHCDKLSERIERDILQYKMDNNISTTYISLSNSPVFVSLKERLSERYEVHITAVAVADISENKSKDVLLISDDEENNRAVVSSVLKNARQLKASYVSLLEDNESNAIYFKTVNKLVKKLEDFYENGEFELKKTWKMLSKVIETTIMKNFVNSILSEAINSFMLNCKFRAIVFPVGKKLNDSDFDYISDSYLRVAVDSKSKHKTIVEKKHDAYEFECYDPDEETTFRKIIPGEYAIGYWKE